MIKIHAKECKRCGKIYMDKSGGIVMNPEEMKNSDLCEECKEKTLKDKVKGFFEKKMEDV